MHLSRHGTPPCVGTYSRAYRTSKKTANGLLRPSIFRRPGEGVPGVSTHDGSKWTERAESAWRAYVQMHRQNKSEYERWRKQKMPSTKTGRLGAR